MKMCYIIVTTWGKLLHVATGLTEACSHLLYITHISIKTEL